MGAEDNLFIDFKRETNTLLDAEKQVKRKDREKEYSLFYIIIKIKKNTVT